MTFKVSAATSTGPGFPDPTWNFCASVPVAPKASIATAAFAGRCNHGPVDDHRHIEEIMIVLLIMTILQQIEADKIQINMFCLVQVAHEIQGNHMLSVCLDQKRYPPMAIPSEGQFVVVSGDLPLPQFAAIINHDEPTSAMICAKNSTDHHSESFTVIKNH